MNKINGNKTPRAALSREKTTRRKPWAPPSSLDAPPAPDGYKYRWIRAETLGQEDNKNLNARLREGFELVRADSDDGQYPTIQEGKYQGVIGVGGLLLAKIPKLECRAALDCAMILSMALARDSVKQPIPQSLCQV